MLPALATWAAFPPLGFQTRPVVWNSFTKAISSFNVANLESNNRKYLSFTVTI